MEERRTDLLQPIAKVDVGANREHECRKKQGVPNNQLEDLIQQQVSSITIGMTVSLVE